MIGLPLPAFYSPTLSLPFYPPLSLPLRAQRKHSGGILPRKPAVFPRGFMEMGNSGVRIIAAIAISGCSLLFLAFLKNVYTDSSQSQTAQEKEEQQQQQKKKNEKNPAPKRSSVSSGKKKVRFSEDVEEPSKNNEEYRRRRRGEQKATTVQKRDADEGRGKGRLFDGAEEKVVELPDNRSALYSGMYQYRSHMSTLMIYG